ncbi:MAG: ATP-binding domain-containing protein, partial [Terriglobales bacterium]
YNRALAEWLRETIPETYSGRITVFHFHALCSEWCRKAGVRFLPPATNADRFWKEDAAWLLVEAIEKVPDRFDAVVADEGQDFYPEWWLPLEQINSKGELGPLYAFYDPAQNLFVEGQSSLPSLGQPFLLPTNCRNTRRIATACADIIGHPVRTRQDAPEGVEVQRALAARDDDQRRMAQASLEGWIRKGGLKMSQVAILSPVRYRNSAIVGLTGAKFPLTEDLGDWRAGRGVLFSTIRAFKGLEADAIILMDVPRPDSDTHFTRSDYYVACSRAKHLLVILLKEAPRA